ncbi:hypothetical protein BGZ94_008982 [Podila epigama]|nr:hypothetical protein BGZ94_008982 [Podila epigama]
MIFSHPSAYMYISRPNKSMSQHSASAVSPRAVPAPPAPGVGGADGATWSPYVTASFAAPRPATPPSVRPSFKRHFGKEDKKNHPYQGLGLVPGSTLSASRLPSSRSSLSLSLSMSLTDQNAPSSPPTSGAGTPPKQL